MPITAGQRWRSYGWPLSIPTQCCETVMSLDFSHLWKHAKQFYPLTSKASLATPFLLTCNIPDSLTLQLSHVWKEKALFHFGILVDARSRKLCSFLDLQEVYNLPRQAFFSYLQILHYAQSLTTSL